MEVQFQNKKRYRNRDVDWLSFNARVLQEAQDQNNPLYERLKFLAIFSSNLDEFFKVRISNLRQLKKVDKVLRRKLALRPNKTLKKILKIVDDQQGLFGKIYRKGILPELAHYHIHLTPYLKYTDPQQRFAEDFFKNKIKPLLTSSSEEEVDPLFFEDGKLYLVVSFLEEDTIGFVKVPVTELSRFVKLPSDEARFHYTFLEDILKANLNEIFPEKKGISTSYQIKLSRDAELYLDDQLDRELVVQIEQSLKQRQSGQPTRLLYDAKMPKALLKRVRTLLGLGKIDTIPGGQFHNFKDFFGFPSPIEDPKLFYKPQPPLPHPYLKKDADFFEIIRQQDRIAHYPYQSFDPLLLWLEQAANDPSVEHIKISLYRVAKDSGLGQRLLKALKNDKALTIFVEAKARFDEENNIEWGKEFQDHGAKVLYSFREIKVHSKILLIQRKEEEKLMNYAYIGTGNFNEKTARIYCDHGLFTANKEITADLRTVFDFFEYPKVKPSFKRLLVSPFNTRERFEALIDLEIQNAKMGLPSGITAKMNSLEDKKMIEKLYEASGAGVSIRLLIRGICCLIPGLEGLSENIEITSIVDRYLEHGRLYLFHNTGNEKMYMGSADWMTRNIDKRIEVLTPIVDKQVFNELKTILRLQLDDNIKARKIEADQKNRPKISKKEEEALRSQSAIYRFLKEAHFQG